MERDGGSQTLQLIVLCSLHTTVLKITIEEIKNMETKESFVLNVWPDVGRALNLSRATTYSLVNQGVIPSIRFGKRIVVPRKALEELLASAGKPKEN